MRATDTDDVSAIFVNGKMVGAATVDNADRDSGWVTINRELTVKRPNVVTFASSNSGGDYRWKFDLRKDEQTVWDATETGKGESSLVQTVQQVVIAPDGFVSQYKAPQLLQNPPPGRWFVRLENIDAVAAAQVNGLPVALVKEGWDSDWVDITDNLSDQVDNQLRFSVWNFRNDYSWRLQLRRDDVIVWGEEQRSATTTGLVADITISIGRDGEVTSPKAVLSGEQDRWAVRAYDIDDVGAIFVNERLAAVATYDVDNADTGWIAIDHLLTNGKANTITVASANVGGDFGFGFLLRREGAQVWGVEEKGHELVDSRLQSRAAVILSDGDVSPAVFAPLPHMNPPGQWTMRLQQIDDIGAVLINGRPVTLADQLGTDWIDITKYLDGNQSNRLRVSVWNMRGDYGWDMAIRRDTATVWSRRSSGSGPAGLVFDEEVEITPQGQLILARPSMLFDEYDWAVRAFKPDDVSAVFVNGRLVSATSSQDGNGDSGWVVIDGNLEPMGENIVAFANGNSGGNYSFGYSLRRGGAEVWTADDNGGGNRTPLQYSQRLRLALDGGVEVLPPEPHAEAPPGNWSVKIDNAGSIVAVQVNGVPVALVQNGGDFQWIDIAQALRTDRVNEVRFSAWSMKDEYSLDVKLRNDETIVWSKEAAGQRTRGLVFDQTIAIAGDGSLVDSETPTQPEPRKWAVRAYETDDVSVVFVNHKMVAAATIDDGRADTGWVNVDSDLIRSMRNQLTFAFSNTGGNYSAGYLLAHDQTGVWGVETNGSGDKAPVQDYWRVTVSPAGEILEEMHVEPYGLRLPGRWYVRVEDVDDVAGVLVNGIPVVVAGSRSPVDWIEITDLLSKEHQTVVTVAAWNFAGNFRWRFSIRRGEVVVWNAERTGSGIIGSTLNQDVIIMPSGVVQSP